MVEDEEDKHGLPANDELEKSKIMQTRDVVVFSWGYVDTEKVLFYWNDARVRMLGLIARLCLASKLQWPLLFLIPGRQRYLVSSRLWHHLSGSESRQCVSMVARRVNSTERQTFRLRYLLFCHPPGGCRRGRDTRVSGPGDSYRCWIRWKGNGVEGESCRTKGVMLINNSRECLLWPAKATWFVLSSTNRKWWQLRSAYSVLAIVLLRFWTNFPRAHNKS